ncbi:hypothetical protein KKC44_06010, partial [Patescibacteria group bacterium]|nr:hypothetical protein [Patescibacteria group bacterium]
SEKQNNKEVVDPSDIQSALNSRSPEAVLELAWKLLYDETDLSKLRETDTFYLVDGVIGKLERLAVQIEDGSLSVEGIEELVPIVNEMRDLARDLAEQMNEIDQVRGNVPSDVVSKIIGETNLSWTGLEKKRGAA